MSKFKIEWQDHGREPRNQPDPRYPTGVDIDFSTWCVDGWPSCKVDLPYPAKRCGAYLIECEGCGMTVVVTTAGRTDDPRSVKFGCRKQPAENLH